METVKPKKQFSAWDEMPEELRQRAEAARSGKANPSSNCGKRAMIELVAGYPGVKKEDYM